MIKNIVELRNELASTFDSIKQGAIDCKEAAELSNLAGKMINSIKVQLEYHSLRNESPDIGFLNAKENGDE